MIGTTDDFEARVHELVRLHGPADALERARAHRMAAEVLIHGIIDTNNRIAAGLPSIDAAGTSRFRRTLSRHIESVVRRATGHDIAAVGAVAAMVVDASFGERRDKPYLDTNEIPWLVGTAYGVALDLRVQHRELAERLVLGPA